jgi:hypothetical protein
MNIKKYTIYSILINILNYLLFFSIAAKFDIENYAIFSKSIFIITVINQLLSLGIYEYFIKNHRKISIFIIYHVAFIILIILLINLIKGIFFEYNSKFMLLEFIYSFSNILSLIGSGYLASIKNFTYVLKSIIINNLLKIIIYFSFLSQFKNNIKYLFSLVAISELILICKLFYKIYISKSVVYKKEKFSISGYINFIKEEINSYLIIGLAFFIFFSSDRIIISSLASSINIGTYFFSYQLFLSPFVIIGYQIYDYLLLRFAEEKESKIEFLYKINIILLSGFIVTIFTSIIIYYATNILIDNYMHDRRYLVENYYLIFSLIAYNILGVKILNIYYIIKGEIKFITSTVTYIYGYGVILLYLFFLYYDIYGLILGYYIITLLLFILIYIKLNESLRKAS